MKYFFQIVSICIVAFFKVQFNGKPGAGPLALIKMGQIVAEARGAIAGLVFSRNSSGAYIRQKVTPINPKTVAQVLVRTLLTAVSQAWRGLTEAQRKAWNTVAATVTFTNIFGDGVAPTGFGLHSRTGRNLQEIGEALLTEPPAPGDVEGFTSLSVVVDNGEVVEADKIKLSFLPALPADQKLIVYATPALSAGVNFVDSEFRKITFIDDADVSPFSIGVIYSDVFGQIPPAGTKVFFKVRPIVIASGQSGTELKASDIAV